MTVTTDPKPWFDVIRIDGEEFKCPTWEHLAGFTYYHFVIALSVSTGYAGQVMTDWRQGPATAILHSGPYYHETLAARMAGRVAEGSGFHSPVKWATTTLETALTCPAFHPWIPEQVRALQKLKGGDHLTAEERATLLNIQRANSWPIRAEEER